MTCLAVLHPSRVAEAPIRPITTQSGHSLQSKWSPASSPRAATTHWNTIHPPPPSNQPGARQMQYQTTISPIRRVWNPQASSLLHGMTLAMSVLVWSIQICTTMLKRIRPKLFSLWCSTPRLSATCMFHFIDFAIPMHSPCRFSTLFYPILYIHYSPSVLYLTDCVYLPLPTVFLYFKFPSPLYLCPRSNSPSPLFLVHTITRPPFPIYHHSPTCSNAFADLPLSRFYHIYTVSTPILTGYLYMPPFLTVFFL